MTGTIVFLIALPLSVYLLAGLLALVDGPGRSRALAAFTLRLAAFAVLLALTPTASRGWIGAAFLTVIVLHTLTILGVRYVVRSGRWPTQRVD